MKNQNECAKKIMSFLTENELQQDVAIYVNNKRYIGTSNTFRLDEGCFNPIDYFEYVNTNHFISMSFEGDFNSILNYRYNIKLCDNIIKEFNEILAKYGYYYELGNSWNLSLYKI